MTESFCVGGGRRLQGSSKSGPGKGGSRKEAQLPLLQDPPKLGMPVVHSGHTVPSQAPLCFDPGNSASDKTEGKKKGRPKAENQALRDIPLSLMNQWKDEFKAHSRVKCPNSGCWLEFPSIYGLKYHYQRCQGPVPVSRPIVVSKPVPVSRPIAISRHIPPCKMVLLSKSENKTLRATGKNSNKKRAADSLDTCPILSKQARPENGAYGPSSMDQSVTFPLSTDPSVIPARETLWEEAATHKDSGSIQM